MSQQLIPINGGVTPEVQTTVSPTRLNVLSPQYIEARDLNSRPTQWVPAGRPIYRRLPAISETYQIDFFNVVTESNALTSNIVVQEGIENVGYVYTPYGTSINGPLSVEVVSSENNKNFLVKGGTIVWKYGKTEVLPVIANLEVLDIGSGKYDVAYQLIYDDSPTQFLYSVEDFALTGLPLDITSSSDSVIGWRYPPVNAFLNSSTLFWSNEDSFFPSYAQPTEAYLQWESSLPQSYSKVVLRLTSGSAYTGTATLYYVGVNGLDFVSTADVSSDSDGQYIEFNLSDATLQTGWNVTFSNTEISVLSVKVTGTVTLVEKPSGPVPRATLVMYPAGTLPKVIVDSSGTEEPAFYCNLAQVDVDNAFTITDITDTRSLIHRDYVPVADWLTAPFDQDLINLYEQVSEYPSLWMAPTSCLKQEYVNLTKSQITVQV